MAKFVTVEDFLAALEDPAHRTKVEELLDWVGSTWPDLELVLKWNQPMFTHHGTYIIGFSAAAKNIAVAPEREVMDRMRADIEAAGYTTTQQLIRIGWDDPVDRDLLTRLIELQIDEKAGSTDFWRS